jgi:chromosome segregation ATPase
MKTFLQNLLIFFSLALCGLIAFQWVRETQLRRDVQGLTDQVSDKSQQVIDLKGNVKRDEAEISRLDGLKNQLTATIKTNETTIDNLHRDLDHTTNELVSAQLAIVKYKDAIKNANEQIETANGRITNLNAEYLKMADDRNEVVKKLNKLNADYSELATRWNEQQERLAKAATNAPPAKK